jgi:hypothetical protein
MAIRDLHQQPGQECVAQQRADASRTCPASPPAARAASRWRLWASAMIRWARETISSPIGVSSDPCAVRTNTFTFSSSSSRAMLFERLGCDRPRTSAALAKLPCRWIAKICRRFLISTAKLS